MGATRAATALVAVATLAGCGTSARHESSSPATSTQTASSSVQVVYSAGYVGGPGRAAVIAHRLPSGRLVTARAKLPWSSHVLRFNPTSQISITVQVRYPVNHPLACGAQTDEQPYGREYTASDESGRRCEVHARLGER